MARQKNRKLQVHRKESKPESAPVPASDSVKDSDVQTAPGGETKTEAKADVELKDNK